MQHDIIQFFAKWMDEILTSRDRENSYLTAPRVRTILPSY